MGDILSSTLNDDVNKEKMTEQAAYIMKIILAILKDMGINLDKYLHEMTSFILKIKEENIISSKRFQNYASKQKSQKKKRTRI